jgi:uncharacterized membrane protein HdeD (DUF308 family)
MNAEANSPSAPQDVPAAAEELKKLREQWLGMLVLGIGLVVLGAIAVGSSFFVSVVTVVMFGVLLLIAGAGQLISAFHAGKWTGFLLQLLVGILYLVVGFMIVDSPVQTATVLTLLIAMFLIAIGVCRIAAAMALHFPGWGWSMLNGGVTLLLGVLIAKEWPASGLIAIGLFVGIEMIFNGWTWIMLGLAIRRFRRFEELPKGA